MENSAPVSVTQSTPGGTALGGISFPESGTLSMDLTDLASIAARGYGQRLAGKLTARPSGANKVNDTSPAPGGRKDIAPVYPHTGIGWSAAIGALAGILAFILAKSLTVAVIVAIVAFFAWGFFFKKPASN